MNDKTKYTEIQSIIPIGEKPIYDLEVEDDHSYSANNIIHHNSSKPVNMQNMPREKNMIRKAFVARTRDQKDSDIHLLNADLSQVELRVAASLANEKNMLEVYQAGVICPTKCDNFQYGHECKEKNCKWSGIINPLDKKCLSCGSTKLEYLARCRHMDLHQRTAEDVKVPRNPLAKNCVIGSSLVLTADGFQTMSELVTDPGRTAKKFKIMSDNGELLETDSTYNGGIQTVSRVEMDYGISITGTPDHEFLTISGGKIVKKEIKDLKINDNVMLMIGQNIHGTNMNIETVVLESTTSYNDAPLPTILDDKTARLFGYIVSEGHVINNSETSKYNLDFGFGKQDLDMVDDVYNCLKHVYGRNPLRLDYEDVVRISVSSKKLVHYLINLGGMAKLSDGKEIPHCIRTAPWNIKKEFLKAYFEGDGTIKIKDKSISVTSKSEKLIRQIQNELFNVGIVGYIGKENRTGTYNNKNYGDYWTYTIKRQKDKLLFKNLIGFFGKRKTQSLIDITTNNVKEIGNRYLEGVECLLEPIYDKITGKKKDKLREVIRRSKNPVRFNDQRIELLLEDLPQEIRYFTDKNIWTVKVKSITDAGSAEVFDLYEPIRQNMIVNSCCIVDCNFGLLYRLGATKFVTYADLYDKDGNPQEDYAREIIQNWHNAYPQIKNWHYSVEEQLKKDNWIATNILGRRRRLDVEKKFNEFKAVTQGIQFLVSGTAQDILKLGMIKIFDFTQNKIRNGTPEERKLWSRFKYIIQVHDELMWECPAAILEEAKVTVKSIVENVAKLKAPIIFSVKSSEKSWEDAH